MTNNVGLLPKTYFSGMFIKSSTAIAVYLPGSLFFMIVIGEMSTLQLIWNAFWTATALPLVGTN